jgi:sigma-B regulation protein RsbU (phosphoserine phosphatase)
MLYFQWHAYSKTMVYSSAGHEHILIYRNRARILETIQSGGMMLGMIPDIRVFLEERQLQLESNDKILLYTDGVTEALNHNQDRFGLSRLKELFERHQAKSADELMKIIRDEVYAFIGDVPQYDDITLVVMEVL